MDKKIYKLSEMWKIWLKHQDDIIEDTISYSIWGSFSIYYKSLEEARRYANDTGLAIAITPADATEFYEGQGLDD